MSGHNKWANIKHRKGAQDAKRSKVFTKIIRELMVSAREGGSDPNTNTSLRTAIEKARAANMPKDTMEKAIKKGAGEMEGQSFSEALYEGYAPGGAGTGCRRPHVRQHDHGPSGREGCRSEDQPLLHGTEAHTGTGRGNRV